MINLLVCLDVRQFFKKEEIYNELDSPQEIFFIMYGSYDIGYSLNQSKQFRLQFGDRTIIAGFNVANNRRMAFNYRAHT